jgi:glutamine synthetase type III
MSRSFPSGKGIRPTTSARGYKPWGTVPGSPRRSRRKGSVAPGDH